jgi:MFS family permease
MVAFEAMGVGTAMPALVADLGALSLYAWPFVAFMAANVFGTVLGGRWCDLAGPRIPLVAGPVLFGAGLLVAGTAASMPQLLVARVLQGLGAGTLTVAVYVLIAVVYPERTRPAIFGLMSSAWVLPSLIGPPVAGVVTGGCPGTGCFSAWCRWSCSRSGWWCLQCASSANPIPVGASPRGGADWWSPPWARR